MAIIPKLNINRKPKDIENNSLVDAVNIKVTTDSGVITGEESIVSNEHINSYIAALVSTYGEYNIIYCIPCNEELVIFVKYKNYGNLCIFRYIESSNKTFLVYRKFKYNGGTLIGTFTYNVDNCLIIAVSEYNENNELNIPLRTINLGKFYENKGVAGIDSNYPNDLKLSNDKLFIVPKVTLPNVTVNNKIKGKCYKGWYHIFIRFKINNIDYTQWYNIGIPIYMDSINKYTIIDYKYGQQFPNIDTIDFDKFINKDKPLSYIVGCSDYFSDEKDICENTFSVSLNYHKEIDYDYYQLGFICVSKDYTKGFKTNDIKKENIDFIFSDNLVDEESVNNLIDKYYNYKNVKCLNNYKNRLYIGNYIEDNYNINKFKVNGEDYDINSINLGFTVEKTPYEFIEKITPIYPFIKYDSHKNSQIYGGEYKDTIENNNFTIPNKISLSNFLNIPYNQKISVIKDVNNKIENISAGSIFIVPIDISKPSKLKIVYSTTELTGLVKIKINHNSTYFNLDENYCYTSNSYINNKSSFDDRRLFTSLIPGEVYNFFIHFVDEFGHATNGIKLNNNREVGYSLSTLVKPETTGNFGYIKVILNNSIATQSEYYILINPKDKVYNGTSFNILETSETPVYKTYKYHIFKKIGKSVNANKFDIDSVYDPISINTEGEKMMGVIYNLVEEYLNIYYLKFNDLYWYQIVYSEQGKTNFSHNCFDYYKNINGDILFKVPQIIDFEKDTSPFNYLINQSLVNIIIKNIKIPDGYVGYYISYEKLENIKYETGLLTKSDFRSQNKIKDGVIDIINNVSNSSKMYFYTSEYDIQDSIKLDYKFLMIEGKNIFKENDIPNYDWVQLANGVKYPIDFNKYQNRISGTLNKLYPINNYKLCVGGSAKDNRCNLGTALEMDIINELFPSNISNDTSLIINNNLYKASLYNPSLNIYTNKNKHLIKCSDIYYKNYIDDEYIKIDKGLNGLYTFNNFIVYADTGLIFNNTEKKAIAEKNITGVDYTSYSENFVQFQKDYYPVAIHHTTEMNRPFAAYIQMPVIKNVMLECKSFNNNPTTVVYPTKIVNTSDGKVTDNSEFYYGSIVTPSNSIDLFKLQQKSSDDANVVINTNYNEELINSTIFTKTIRRSDIIKDESRQNNWRRFALEGYKYITENKGEINNILGLGYALLIHTNDSLFIFDTNNVLKTQETNIQIQQPDAFDVNYKEVFSSELGFGGLQTRQSWISGEFGYIYYNKDSNRLYRFDNNSIDIIDNDIINWLNVAKPDNVKFAHDRINNRLLIKFYYKDTNIVLSYNYQIKAFVSKHVYDFENAYNTKNNLYYNYSVDNLHNKIYSPTKDFINYNGFENSNTNVDNAKPTFSICVNIDYDTIKFIDAISYINRIIDNTKLADIDVNTAILDNNNLPVEGMDYKYSGDFIRIYNDMCDTGELNVATSIDYNSIKDFDKPFYQKGVWNFNYFRDIKNAKTIKASDMSRIYGKYFIIKFTMSTFVRDTFEFEDLTYKLSKDI